MLTEYCENDPQVKRMLWEGEVDTLFGKKVAILMRVLRPEKKVYFDLKDPASLEMPSVFSRYWTSIRPFSLTAVCSPGLVVFFAGVLLDEFQPDVFLFLMSFLSVAFLQAAINVFNDVQDHLRGIDFPGDIGGSGVIQKGWISARVLSRFAYGLLAISIGFGVFPFIRYPAQMAAVALMGFVGAMGYSGFGIGFKYRALGDVVVFILCGPALVIGYSLATFGRYSATHLTIGGVFGLAAVGLLHANNLNDLEVDQNRGARTIASSLGFKRSQKYLTLIYFWIVATLLISVIFFKVNVVFGAFAFLVYPWVAKLIQKVKNASGPLSPELAMIRFEAAQIHLAIGVSWGMFFILKWILETYVGS